MTALSPQKEIRSAVSRRDLSSLRTLARSTPPALVATIWPKLRALERVALFRALPADAARDVFARLTLDQKWLAYLSELSEGAAPLLEGASPSSAKSLRRASTRERAAMREALR